MSTVASISDFRTLARRRLPKFLFEYIDGGSYDEVTLNRNRDDLASIALRQRVLRDVSRIDLSARILGQDFAMPVGLAPIGLAGMNARRGECQAVKAANRHNIPFTLSTVSACSIDEVAKASDAPFWFQLYMIRDRGFMRELLNQAKAAGCPTLVFTVDMPVPGSRYRDYRSGLAGAPGLMGDLRRVWQSVLRPQWAWDVGLWGRPHSLGNVAPVLGPNTGLEDFFAWMRNNFEPRVSWDDIGWIRSHWDGDLIVKGVLDAEDAVQAVKSGVDGIVVSNHGGRQLDGTPSTAKALGPIAQAVSGQTTLLVDGGVRSGLDVVRMLALGADGVLLGRAWAYALAAGGEDAICKMLSLIEAEMKVAMALTGHTSIEQISEDTICQLSGSKLPNGL